MSNKRLKQVVLSLNEKYEIAQLLLCKYEIVRTTAISTIKYYICTIMPLKVSRLKSF